MIPAYLKSRAKIITLLLVIIGVFSASSLLFEMPLITVLYPAVVSIIIVVIAGIADYLRIRSVRDELEADIFSPTDSLIEQEYQRIIDRLKEEEQVARSSAAADYNNMIEYYTVWAHQIKTPIASMRLALQSEDSEFARKLGSDLDRIEAYVEMVLTYLRLDSDSTDYLIRTYDLDEVIRSSVRKFSRRFILKKLSMDFEPTGLSVLTDEKWLQFVLEQVISNAVKYTNQGGVRIYQSSPRVLCIEDSGIGICAEDLPRVFENGFTGFNGREDKRASGIGLYLCRRICDNLGHRIYAESVLGVGTKIYLDLNNRQLGIE